MAILSCYCSANQLCGHCRPKKRLNELVPGVTDDALHLMTALLHFNPHKRLSADEALRHQFVKRSTPTASVLSHVWC